jgi:hypothetical protein
MNRWALRPTGMFIGRHALIGTSMAMDCFCRTDALAFLVQLPPRRSADATTKQADPERPQRPAA